MTREGSPLDRLRDPAHTGENRCRPCTVVNAALAVLLAGAIAVIAPPLALVALVASAAVIYLRGYLVPGTPTLTKRYLPERMRRAFGKPPADAGAQEWETLQKLEYHREHAVDPDAFLAETGVVTTTDPDDRRLTDAFEAALADHADAFEDVRTPLAELLETDPVSMTVETDPYPVVTVDNRMREWPSEAALAADATAHLVLTEWTDDWSAVPLEQRLDLLSTVRALRTDCPDCGGSVARRDEAVESCCGIHEVLAVACTDCEARLAELETSSDASKLDL